MTGKTELRITMTQAGYHQARAGPNVPTTPPAAIAAIAHFGLGTQVFRKIHPVEDVRRNDVRTAQSSHQSTLSYFLGADAQAAE
jgi:hypothetical protein